MRKTTYTCDQCGKSPEKESEQFPYDEEWMFLDNLTLRLDENWDTDEGDKHFCSTACLIRGIKRFIEHDKEEIKKMDNEDGIELENDTYF